MAAYNKFNAFVEHLCDKVHDLFGTTGADLAKIMLVNSPAPVATNTVKADLTEITAANGYTAGGEDTQNDGTRSTGTFTLTCTSVLWTASGGTIGPFQYVVFYNDTPTSPADPLIGWWDRGAALTLQDGESFRWKPNNSATTGTVFTLA